ncbi:hypothetical protein RJT34_18129 [Clitoria ternatea]|uniref:Uncharacterized protein n=1 Tax=Clitoria ternatea TaxID=43366 RepID=A0AAN9JDC9_CLITE
MFGFPFLSEEGRIGIIGVGELFDDLKFVFLDFELARIVESNVNFWQEVCRKLSQSRRKKIGKAQNFGAVLFLPHSHNHFATTRTRSTYHSTRAFSFPFSILDFVPFLLSSSNSKTRDSFRTFFPSTKVINFHFVSMASRH